nr:hypothetical protein [Candidatus Sigynarchaeum springense]
MKEKLQKAMLKRINFKVVAGEDIKYVYFDAAGGFEMVNTIFMIFMLPLAGAMLITTMGMLIPLFGVGEFSASGILTNLAWSMTASILASTLITLLLRNRLLDYYSFNFVIFTDKAMYTALNFSKRRDVGYNALARTRYSDIIGIDFGTRTALRMKPCPGIRMMLNKPLAANARTIFSVDLKFRNADEFSSMKNFLESLVFGYQPLDVQQAMRYKILKKDPPPMNGDLRFNISQPGLERLRERRKRLAISTPVGLGIASLIVIVIMEVTWGPVDTVTMPNFMIFFMTAIIGPYLMVAIALINTKEYKRLGTFLSQRFSSIEIDNKGLTIWDGGKESRIPFSRDLVYSICASPKNNAYFAAWEADTLVLGRTGDKTFTVQLGPVEDVFSLYYAFLFKYSEWMRANESFFSPDEIRAMMLRAEPFKEQVVEKLSGQGAITTERPLPPSPAPADSLKLVDDMSKTGKSVLETMTGEIGATRYPIRMYEPYLEPGERLINVYQPKHVMAYIFNPGLVISLVMIAVVTVGIIYAHVVLGGAIVFLAEMVAMLFNVMCCCFQGCLKLSIVPYLKRTEILFSPKKMIISYGGGKLSIVPRENFSHVVYGKKVMKGKVFKTIQIHFSTPLVQSPFIDKTRYFLYLVDDTEPLIAIIDEFAKMKIHE